MNPKVLRFLVATHAPWSTEHGAAQIAINLTEHLRAGGHHVVTWSGRDHSKLKGSPGLGTRLLRVVARRHAERRRALVDFAREHGPFDVIDCPPVYAAAGLKRHCRLLLVRTVQPDLHYTAMDLREKLGAGRVASVPGLLGSAALVTSGYAAADLILCLGSIEAEWMRRRMPWWASKVRSHVMGLADNERAWLAQCAEQRQPHRTGDLDGRRGIRFIWIGRLCYQKGSDRLFRIVRERLQRFPDDHFTIAGFVDPKAAKVPVDLRNHPRVQLIPRFSRAELPELLLSHDAGLMTSRVEGWGLVMNEMIESGLVVFSAPVGGQKDLSPCVEGLRSLESSAVTEPEVILRSPRGYRSAECRQRFSWRSIGVDYLTLATQMLASGSR